MALVYLFPAEGAPAPESTEGKDSQDAESKSSSRDAKGDQYYATIRKIPPRDSLAQEQIPGNEIILWSIFRKDSNNDIKYCGN